MNHSGKFLRFVKLIMAFFIFAMLVLAGCAGESVRVEFPVNHPANPEAHETEFTLPQNLFQTDAAVMEGGTETDSMMNHKTHEESGKQHMDHNMGTDKESPADSESTKKPDHREGNNQHKEHSQ
jgi:hypothetical protein